MVLDPVRPRRHHHRLADAVDRPRPGQGGAVLSGLAPGDRGQRLHGFRPRQDHARDARRRDVRPRRGAVRPLLRRGRHHLPVHRPGRSLRQAHQRLSDHPRPVAEPGGGGRVDDRLRRLQRRRPDRLRPRRRHRPDQPGLEGLRGLHLLRRRPLSQGADRPAGGAGLRLRRLEGPGRDGRRPGRRARAPVGRPRRDGPRPGRGALLDGGRGLLRHRPGRRRRAVPGHRLQRRASTFHRPALARAGAAGDAADADGRVPFRLGPAHPGQGAGPLQSDELSQRLGLAP
ncbi:hypothetical protein D3C77_408200 [compost metagenome]